MKMTPAEFRALLRKSLYTFIVRAFRELNPETEFLHNWHIEKIADELEKCLRGETNRLCIVVPPRSLKSHSTSVSFPAFVLGHNPAAKIICVSYGQDLADKNALDCRTVMLSDWYKRAFACRLSNTRPALSDFRTTRNGFRLSVSVGGPLTGRGADFIIVDDPLKPDEALSDTQRKAVNDWYDHTLLTRLDNKNTGCIIVIMQRLHEDDLVGHLLKHGGWKLVRLPAIAEENEIHEISTLLGLRRVTRRVGECLHPERESLQTLEMIRATIGEYNFAGQYQQAPAPFGGGFVKIEWIKSYTPAEIPGRWDFDFQSWDTANKPSELSDYSVCTTWGVAGWHVYLLSVLRERLDYPALKRAVREQAHRFGPTVILVEDKASGTQLIQELTYEGLHAIKSYKPTMDKVMRLHTVCASFENGCVHLPQAAPWLNGYIHELVTFPNGKFDDQVDSTSQALDWFKKRYFGSTVTFGTVSI
ncbi:MAG: phage terminase large subunit [Terriglobales bacterium]